MEFFDYVGKGRVLYILYLRPTVTARERAYFLRRHNLMRKLNGDFFSRQVSSAKQD